MVDGRVVAILCPDPDALPHALPKWVRLLVADTDAAAVLRAAHPDRVVVVLDGESSSPNDCRR